MTAWPRLWSLDRRPRHPRLRWLPRTRRQPPAKSQLTLPMWRPARAAAGMPEAGAAPEKTTEPGAAGVAKVDDSAAKEAAPLPKPAVTAGSAGLAAAPEGILMRYNSDSREWIASPGRPRWRSETGCCA